MTLGHALGLALLAITAADDGACESETASVEAELADMNSKVAVLKARVHAALARAAAEAAADAEAAEARRGPAGCSAITTPVSIRSSFATRSASASPATTRGPRGAAR